MGDLFMDGRVPEDIVEHDALNDDGPCCPAKFKGFGCTRQEGHTGDHVAAGKRLIYARWAQA